MKTLKEKIARLIVAASFVTVVGNAEAASSSETFFNDYASNYIFLFADEHRGNEVLTFDNVTFGGTATDWQADSLSPSLAIFSGSQLSPGAGSFVLDFTYNRNSVSFQWAEVFFDNGVVNMLGEGTASFRNSRFGPVWSGSSNFSNANQTFVNDYFANIPAAAVPIPPSIVMLLSAATFVGFSRRSGADSGLLSA